MIYNPIETIKLFFINNSSNPVYDNVKLEFYYVYLLCGGFLLFYRPVYLLLFIPILAKKMLNDAPLRLSTDTYYSVEFISMLPIVVFLIISEVKTKLIKTLLIIVVCVGSVFITVYKLQRHEDSSVFWSDSKHSFYRSEFYNPGFNVRKINQQISQIPSDAKISATNTIIPHIAWRSKLYLFPKVADAEYIVVCTDRDTYPITRIEFDSILNFYMNNDNWKILVDEFPFLILKKDKNECKHHIIKPKKVLEYICDAESISLDNQTLLSSSGLHFYNAEMRSNKYSHGGGFSVMVTKESPYGMTTLIDSVNAGEKFEITVWRMARNNNAKLIACSTIKNSYYNSEFVIEKKDEDGWELLKKRLFITQNWPNRELKIYLWNGGEDTVFFDDLHIVREINNPN